MGDDLLSAEQQKQLEWLLTNGSAWQQPPYALIGIGLVIALLCGLTFARQIQQRLDQWQQDRLPLLPLARPNIVIPYAGVLLGTTLFVGSGLQVFGFAAGSSLLVALLLTLLTGAGLWYQLGRLMQQVECGNFAAVDFDNFDRFL